MCIVNKLVCNYFMVQVKLYEFLYAFLYVKLSLLKYHVFVQCIKHHVSMYVVLKYHVFV